MMMMIRNFKNIKAEETANIMSLRKGTVSQQCHKIFYPVFSMTLFHLGSFFICHAEVFSNMVSLR